MLVEHPVALARADKNLKKDIPWISVSAVGMFEGCLADIQRIEPMSEVDIAAEKNLRPKEGSELMMHMSH